MCVVSMFPATTTFVSKGVIVNQGVVWFALLHAIVKKKNFQKIISQIFNQIFIVFHNEA